MSSISADKLLNEWPMYQGEYITIKEDQTVPDIMTEIVAAHKEFREYYDSIAIYFAADTTKKICENIYFFLKKNVRYKEESKEEQTTALPSRILTIQQGDCKHYASMAGGILDALNRQGYNIEWFYRFASYEFLQRTPYHVFVVVIDDDGQELWIDPTPGAASMTPMWMQDKKIKKSPMALRRYIAGLYTDNFNEAAIDPFAPPTVDYGTTDTDVILPRLETPLDFYDPETEDDANLSPELISAIDLLLQYGVLDTSGNFNNAQFYVLANQVEPEIYEQLMTAVTILDEQSKISGLFSSIWRGVKKVTLAAPRGAYLALVSLNVFGYATKLAQAMSTGDGFQKVRDRWYKLGGDLAKLQGAINAGKKRNRILGINSIGTPAAVAAWVGVAGAIIAAIMPLIKEILNKQKGDQVPYIEGYDPSLINMPDNYSSGNNPLDWIKSHPLESAGIALLAYVGLKKFKVL